MSTTQPTYDQQWYTLFASMLMESNRTVLKENLMRYVDHCCAQRARVNLIREARSEKGAEMQEREEKLLEHLENCQQLCRLVREKKGYKK